MSGCASTTVPVHSKPIVSPELLAEPLEPIKFEGGNEYDLLKIHVENSSRWAQTREQLKLLIKYVKESQ